MENTYLLWLIDDDKINNLIFEYELHKLTIPHKLIAFTDPIRALESLLKVDESQKPHLIFLDIKMEGLSGWQFLDKLQEHNLDFPVIITTTSISKEDKNKADAHALVMDYLVKPIYKFKLTHALSRLS